MEGNESLVFMGKRPRKRFPGKLRITDWWRGCNTGTIVVERAADYTFSEALDLLMSVHCNDNNWVRRIVRVSPRKILLRHGLGPGYSPAWISIKGSPGNIRLIAQAIKHPLEKLQEDNLRNLDLSKLYRLLKNN